MLKKEFNDLKQTIFHHKKYGEYEIVEYKNSDNVKIRFRDTGYEYVTSMNHIENNEVMDRLYKNIFGGVVGIYGYDVDIYKMWYNMLYRANKQGGSYKDSSVCQEWLYFPNFHDWAKKTKISKGMAFG